MLLELFLGLFLSFILLYILSSIAYLFSIHMITEKDMLNFYKGQWKTKK